MLYRVMPTSAEIDWCVVGMCTTAGKAMTPLADVIGFCELIFGPVNRPDEVQVLPNFRPDGQPIELFGLRLNVTYHFHMVCYNGLQSTEDKFTSNRLVFTTGEDLSFESDIESTPDKSRSQWINSSISGVISAGPDDDDVVRGVLVNQQRHPLDLVAGVLAGITGLLIMIVTVVIIVRRYSYWWMTHRRMEEDINAEV